MHYREQSLVVATAKIIIMSALGLGPTLAWRHRVHRSQKYRTLLELKAFFYQTKLKKTRKAGIEKRFFEKSY